MKVRSLVAAAFLTIGGCNSVPSVTSIAGYYTSTPIDKHENKWADGTSHVVTRELTLTLSPNGTYGTWWFDYSDGQLIRFSGLADYDLQSNSAGTWRIEGHQLVLESSGPNFDRRRTLGLKVWYTYPSQKSRADLVYQERQWTVVWKGTVYYFKKELPNKAAEPTRTSGTPPADAGDRASGARGSP